MTPAARQHFREVLKSNFKSLKLNIQNRFCHVYHNGEKKGAQLRPEHVNYGLD